MVKWHSKYLKNGNEAFKILKNGKEAFKVFKK
jgi:hypothetical protein